MQSLDIHMQLYIIDTSTKAYTTLLYNYGIIVHCLLLCFHSGTAVCRELSVDSQLISKLRRHFGR